MNRNEQESATRSYLEVEPVSTAINAILGDTETGDRLTKKSEDAEGKGINTVKDAETKNLTLRKKPGKDDEGKGISTIKDGPETNDWMSKKEPGKDEESKAVNAILDDPETSDWLNKKKPGMDEESKAIKSILDNPATSDWISKKNAKTPKTQLSLDCPRTTLEAKAKNGCAHILQYIDGVMDPQYADANSPQPTTNILGQPSLNRQRRHQQVSLPGAFHLDGPGAGQTGPDPEAPIQEDYTPDALDTRNTQSLEGNGELVVARMVDEVPTDMPCARPSEPETSSQQKPRSLMLGCGVLLLLVVVLAGVLALTSKGNKDIDSELLLLSLSPSHGPSLAPSSQESYLLSLLPDHTINAVQDPESAQARAFNWALEDLELSPVLSPQRIVQRFSLVCFYFSTGGEMWNKNEHWLNHTVHECEWYNGKDFAGKTHLNENLGLTGYLSEFFPSSEPQPTRCEDDSGLFQHLWLDANNLIGTMPPEMGLLSSLQTISLGLKNQLRGTLPSQFGQLTSLEGAVIDYVWEFGVIPTQVGLLTKLKGLSLGGEDLDSSPSGTIPTELGLLTNIQTLQLFNRELHGKVLDIMSFPKLRWLLLHGNHLTGTIPTQIGLIKTIDWITAGGNNFTGTLPSQLGMLSNAGMLSFFFNQLEGTLPTELGLLSASSLLSFRGNLWTGTIPSQFGLLKNLSVALSLHDNPGLTGTIPTELGLLSNLYRLVLSNNNLTGPIPSEFGMLHSLAEIWLGSNFLSGTIPQALAPLQQSLYGLDVSNNPLLSGTLPAPLCNLNGTCIQNTLRDPCIEGTTLVFNCTDLFCACDCACTGYATNSSIRHL